MKIPFILASSLIVICEVVTSSLRAAEFSSASVSATVAGVVYVAISVSSGIFFVVIGSMIISRIKVSLEMTKGNLKVKATLRRVRLLRKSFPPLFLTLFLTDVTDHYSCHVNGYFQLDFLCGHDSSYQRQLVFLDPRLCLHVDIYVFGCRRRLSHSRCSCARPYGR
jgi:hypothetical protein